MSDCYNIDKHNSRWDDKGIWFKTGSGNLCQFGSFMSKPLKIDTGTDTVESESQDIF